MLLTHPVAHVMNAPWQSSAIHKVTIWRSRDLYCAIASIWHTHSERLTITRLLQMDATAASIGIVHLPNPQICERFRFIVREHLQLNFLNTNTLQR